jgi:hypothetical protein
MGNGILLSTLLRTSSSMTFIATTALVYSTFAAPMTGSVSQALQTATASLGVLEGITAQQAQLQIVQCALLEHLVRPELNHAQAALPAHSALLDQPLALNAALARIASEGKAAPLMDYQS